MLVRVLKILFLLLINGGGDSTYGSNLIDSLFGKKYADQKRCLANRLVFVDWRASQDNLAYIDTLLNNDKNLWLHQVAEGIKQSIAQGKHYYREHYTTSCSTKNITKKSLHVTAKIMAIIDAGNFSATLDFIDELKLMDSNVVLIGQQTGADRLYIEARTVPLPSGLGSFIFPIKGYRNRPRLDNQPYVPDVKYKYITNTKKLQDFIINMNLS